MKDYSEIYSAIPENLSRGERLQRFKEMNAEFRKDLEAIYGPGGTQKQQDILFEKAWEDGHAEGYNAIVGVYCDLVELITKYNKAGSTNS